MSFPSQQAKLTATVSKANPPLVWGYLTTVKEQLTYWKITRLLGSPFPFFFFYQKGLQVKISAQGGGRRSF